MATWHHWGCCWVLWCGCVPLGPEGWGEGRWGTAGSGGRRGDFESCVVKKQTEELCLWLWQTPCMGWECVRVWLDEGQIHTLWQNDEENDHPRTHSYTCGFTCTRPTTEQKWQLLKGNKPCRKELRLTDCTLITYLKPSTFGIKRLGFGGSLWQRGTLTGRGLFLGAKQKTETKKKNTRTTP